MIYFYNVCLMKMIHFNLNKQSIYNYFYRCFTCKRTVCLTCHNDRMFWLGTHLDISQAIYNPCINRVIVRTNSYAVVFVICKIWRWEPFMFQITFKHLKKSLIILFQTIHFVKPKSGILFVTLSLTSYSLFQSLV